MADWFNKGKNFIWHPYSNVNSTVLKVVGAKDSSVFVERGGKVEGLVDGVASWWSVIHGYGNEFIIGRIEDQLKKLPHVMFGGLAHEWAYVLAQKLVGLLPKGFGNAFFVESGSVAVEAAARMAVSYFNAKGRPSKRRFLSFFGGYHGDTYLASRLSCSNASANVVENGDFISIALPRTEEDFAFFEEFLEKRKDEIAAIFLEPLLQCAGGMLQHDVGCVKRVEKAARGADVLLVFDECAVGFYRLGSMFAFLQTKAVPDILLLGKALTCGYLPAAAAIASKEVFSTINASELGLNYGPTFMANPLAMVAAVAGLELLDGGSYKNKATLIEAMFNSYFGKIKHYKMVKRVLIVGAVAALELNMTKVQMQRIKEKVADYGVWLRPFANVLYAMPPLTINCEDLGRLCAAMIKIVEDLSSGAFGR